MIRIFKKLRLKQLVENKYIKYLLYIVGEVALVVIGILIALQVNNKNEASQKKANFDILLDQVISEVEDGIINSAATLEQIAYKDSIIAMTLDEKLTRESYIEDFDLSHTVTSYIYFDFPEDGYLELIRNIDDVSENQREITKKLRELYVLNDRAKITSKAILEDVKSTHAKWKEKHPWYWKWRKERKFQEEQIDFYLNDPIYKNYAAFYLVLTQNMSTIIEEMQVSSKEIISLHSKIK